MMRGLGGRGVESILVQETSDMPFPVVGLGPVVPNKHNLAFVQHNIDHSISSIHPLIPSVLQIKCFLFFLSMCLRSGDSQIFILSVGVLTKTGG